ncbi:MAG: hypothetical protein V9F01_04780 [Chitinophagaceae bacterium]
MAKCQLVRVPHYQNATYYLHSHLLAMGWLKRWCTGFECTEILIVLTANIDVSGRGFNGGIRL